MPPSSTPPFKLACPDCEVTQGLDTYHESTKYADKHAEHTGHEMEWVRAEFDHVPELDRRWQVACGKCDRNWHFASQEGASAFRDEHAEYTDHRIERAVEETELQLPNERVDAGHGAGVLSLIGDLEEQFEKGAPEGAVYAYFGEDMTQVAEVQQTIEQLKREGKVYEAPATFFRRP